MNYGLYELYLYANIYKHQNKISSPDKIFSNTPIRTDGIEIITINHKLIIAETFELSTSAIPGYKINLIKDNKIRSKITKRIEKLKKLFEEEMPLRNLKHVGLEACEVEKIINLHGKAQPRTNLYPKDLIDKFVLDGRYNKVENTIQEIEDYYKEVLNNIKSLKLGKSEEYRQQAGFKTGHSSLNPALALDTLLRHSNGNMINVTLYIKKAYDSVDRNKLYWKLIKLQKFSIRDTKLIAHLIENNKYTLCSNKATSLVKTASIGPPKDTVALKGVLLHIGARIINTLYVRATTVRDKSILKGIPTTIFKTFLDIIIPEHKRENIIEILVKFIQHNIDHPNLAGIPTRDVTAIFKNFLPDNILKLIRADETVVTGVINDTRRRDTGIEGHNRIRIINKETGGNNKETTTDLSGNSQPGNTRIPSKEHIENIKVSRNNKAFMDIKALLIKNESSEDDNTEKKSRAINDNNEEEKNKVVEGDKNILNTKWDIKNSKVTKESDAVDTTRLAMIEDKNGIFKTEAKDNERIREKPISLSQPRNTEELKRITNEDRKDYDISTEGLEGLIRYSERLEPRLKNEDKCKEQMKYKTEVAITSKNKEHKPIMNISYRLNNTKLNKEQKILITQGNLHLHSKDVVNMVFLSKTVLEVICKEGKKEAVNRVFRNIGARLLKNSPEVDSNGLFKISGFLARMKRIKYRKSNNNYKLRRLALHEVIESLNIKANDIEMDNVLTEPRKLTSYNTEARRNAKARNNNQELFDRFYRDFMMNQCQEHVVENTYKLNPNKCFYNASTEYECYIVKDISLITNVQIPKKVKTIRQKAVKVAVIPYKILKNSEFSRETKFAHLRFRAYKTFIRPHIDYFSQLLGCNKTSSKEQIENRKALQIPIPYAIFPIEDSTQRARRLRGNIAHKIINSRKTLLRHISNQQTPMKQDNVEPQGYKAHMKLVVTGDNYHLEGGNLVATIKGVLFIMLLGGVSIGDGLKGVKYDTATKWVLVYRGVKYMTSIKRVVSHWTVVHKGLKLSSKGVLTYKTSTKGVLSSFSSIYMQRGVSCMQFLNFLKILKY
ncbi:hypothetical protein CWI38_0068p0010 [Hamiltosporidium tvaerminnensis]|uniref:Uncharacterized protein n=1 Tax=Hamiltosporidium tvaerminnensis TaxID=1176355 RepID=A0A4Q9M4A0_9MICR|nr:hypothetical protein CWI38_0068p0010 [Hamiltosporidium tvaerminnensis]